MCFLIQRKYIVLYEDGYFKQQSACMHYLEMDFISVHDITNPKPNLVIIICHRIMSGSCLPKDSIFLLLPLAVIWKKVLDHNAKDFPNPEVNDHSDNCHLCILLP